MAVVTGCSGNTEPGTPVPQSSSVTSSTSTASARPAVLALDDLAPCDLFTTELRERFGLREDPIAGTDSLGQSTCQMLAGPPGGYLITAATAEGMERFDGIPEDMGIVSSLTVDGFPAAQLRDTHQPNACLIGVDVADGQYLGVFVSDVPEDGTPDEICANAVTFAEFAVATLRQQLER